MSLRPKRVREAAHTVELAQHSFELGPVTQSYHRADGLAADDRRHAVRDQHPVPCEQHLIRAASLSGQHVTHAPRRYALVDPPSFDGALEAKQAPGFVVHEVIRPSRSVATIPSRMPWSIDSRCSSSAATSLGST